ncbi:hypothetical protein PBAL39_13777 [Pedobacter sp. BAL39]|nr:hypothetical protein PBAL39_13777 [Pedobacter sp. BAL39]
MVHKCYLLVPTGGKWNAKWGRAVLFLWGEFGLMCSFVLRLAEWSYQHPKGSRAVKHGQNKIAELR